MTTKNPTKGIRLMEDYMKSRLRKFKGSFKDINSLMLKDFDFLFDSLMSSIYKKEEEKIKAYSLFPERINDSKKRMIFLLGSFGDKMEELSLKLIEKNSDLSSQEINTLLFNKTVERIQLISRTEVPNLSSSLEESFAIDKGFFYFLWETKRDKRVGEDHRKLQGKVFRMDDLPVNGFPQRSRPNCRCHARFIHIEKEEYQKLRDIQITEGVVYANS